MVIYGPRLHFLGFGTSKKLTSVRKVRVFLAQRAAGKKTAVTQAVGNHSRTWLAYNTIHIKAARFIQRIKKSVPDHEVLQTANWHSISWYCKRRTACITHKLFNGNDPNKDIITKRTITRNLRSNLLIQKHQFKSMKYKNSFTYRCATIWNKLSDRDKELDYDDFKRKISLNKDILNDISYT